MAHFEWVLHSDAPAEMVRAALLDFTDRRPQLWPGIPPDQYEVYEVGDTWAEIREGYRGAIWVRERYDWSDPDRVTYTAVDSGFLEPGSQVVTVIEPAADGGSRVRVSWDRRGMGTFGKVFVGFMALTRGYFIRRSIQSGLDAIGARHEPPT